MAERKSVSWGEALDESGKRFWETGIGHTLADALDYVKLPGQVAKGEVSAWDPETGHVSDDVIAKSAGGTLAMGLGAGAVQAAKPGLKPDGDAFGVFIGRKGGERLGKGMELEVAQGLHKQGFPIEDIRQQTGWSHGPRGEGDWQYEISDRDMHVKPHALVDDDRGGMTTSLDGDAYFQYPTLADSLHHPEFLAAYPEAADLSLQAGHHRFEPPGGVFDSQGRHIRAQGMDEQEMREILAHELQHASDSFERKPGGSSPKWTRQEMELAAGDGLLPPEIHRAYENLSEKEKNALAYRRYRHDAGEVNAEITRNRLDLTPEQRLERAPRMDLPKDIDPDLITLGRASASYGSSVKPEMAKLAEAVENKPSADKASDAYKAELGAKANAQNAANAEDVRWNPPDADPMWWPWRAELGTYSRQFNDKENKYFLRRDASADEKELQKALAKAEKEVKTGQGVEAIFGPDDIYKQQMRNETLPVATRSTTGTGKGIPQHVLDNVAPESGAEERLLASIERGQEAKNWYHTGRLQDDLAEALGPEAGQQQLDDFGAFMGATTSDATPPSNVRMAAHQQAIMDQQRKAEPNATPRIPENPQYPYGHARYNTTHKPILKRLAEDPYIDTLQNPKGGEFAGSISGQSNKAVMDRVMMEDVLQAKDAKGKLLQTPDPGTYGTYRDWMDEVSSRHGLEPDEAQAMAWAGHNPDKVEQYSKPLVGHLSDRINVTAKVMSQKAGREVSPWEVYYRWVTEKIPLLTVPAGAGLAAALDGGSDEADPRGRPSP